MAGGLMRHTSIMLVLVCMAAASTAVAQALRDPTRPPAGSEKGIGSKPEHSGWILQSVLISPERRYAIINGEVVAIGGAIAGAELVAIVEGRVTLRTQDGLRIVRLFPDVTRLDVAESSGAAKPSTAPRPQKSNKAQKSESSGMTK